jgi:hypothetical protein
VAQSSEPAGNASSGVNFHMKTFRSLRAALAHPKMMKSGCCSATDLHGSVALPFVIPSEAEGSAVRRILLGNVFDRARWCDLLFISRSHTPSLAPEVRLSIPLPSVSPQPGGFEDGECRAGVMFVQWLSGRRKL